MASQVADFPRLEKVGFARLLYVYVVGVDHCSVYGNVN